MFGPFNSDTTENDSGRDDSDSAGRAHDYRRAREELVDRLQAREYVDRESTAEALRAVPRHEFVPSSQRSAAYEDRPLPIGEGQTISAPHMVGMMTDLLAPEPGDRVLEIGTGCGYHAAVTGEIVGDGNLYSVEYVRTLALEARERLDELGYDVRLRVGDGREGWPEHAPYDGAYLTCAAGSIPQAIVEQVRDGGRIVAPIGDGRQELIRATVGEATVTRRETHGGVRFVTMQ